MGGLGGGGVQFLSFKVVYLPNISIEPFEKFLYGGGGWCANQTKLNNFDGNLDRNLSKLLVTQQRKPKSAFIHLTPLLPATPAGVKQPSSAFAKLSSTLIWSWQWGGGDHLCPPTSIMRKINIQ